MDMAALVSPLTFALLCALAAACVWLALAPVRRTGPVGDRLDDYVSRQSVPDAAEMARPFTARALMPMIRRLLRFLAGFMPKRNLEKTARMLVRAGEPGGLTALDFLGLRLLVGIAAVVGYFYFSGAAQPAMTVVRNCLIALTLGLFLPQFWLRRRARGRQHTILRALPDALDMLTIGVEAGLAFESAMLRVGDQWHNPLTQEFRRTVAEMRMGASRSEALERMAERAGVDELSTFVAVLVQSSQLGVSIADVLRTQSDQMRLVRRQRAEELAHQASVKMILALFFFVLPSMLIVVVGPLVPRLRELFAIMAGVK